VAGYVGSGLGLLERIRLSLAVGAVTLNKEKFMMAVKALTWMGAAVLSFTFAVSAWAGGLEERVRELKDSLSIQIKAMEEAKQRVDESAGGMEEADCYIWAALNVVDLAKLTANLESTGRMDETNDLLSLVGKGYLPYWPGNPFNNWEPMRVLHAGDGFSAGDLCMMVCPLAAYSDMGAGPVAASYQLFIYGPGESAATLGSIYMAGTNKTWCTPPPYAMYGIGFYAMSDAESEAQQKKIEEYKKNHPDWDKK
jgi:hypothetical protein